LRRQSSISGLPLGAGMLFLTQYSNEMQPNPVNDEELTLDFQGLTRDGRYYLAARLAITHPSLPRGIDFTDNIERDLPNYRYLKKRREGARRISREIIPPITDKLEGFVVVYLR
jgi:hypothetical protein